MAVLQLRGVDTNTFNGHSTRQRLVQTLRKLGVELLKCLTGVYGQIHQLLRGFTTKKIIFVFKRVMVYNQY